MGWITPIAFLLCHTYSIGDAATLETFSSKSVLSPERGALTGHFRKYLGFVCPAARNPIFHSSLTLGLSGRHRIRPIAICGEVAHATAYNYNRDDDPAASDAPADVPGERLRRPGA